MGVTVAPAAPAPRNEAEVDTGCNEHRNALAPSIVFPSRLVVRDLDLAFWDQFKVFAFIVYQDIAAEQRLWGRMGRTRGWRYKKNKRAGAIMPYGMSRGNETRPHHDAGRLHHIQPQNWQWMVRGALAP